jgi:hypothetical protein
MSGQSESIGPWKPEAFVWGAQAAGEIFFFFIPKWRRLMPDWISIPILLLTVSWTFRIAWQSGLWGKMRSMYNFSAIRPLKRVRAIPSRLLPIHFSRIVVSRKVLPSSCRPVDNGPCHGVTSCDRND